MLSRLICRIFKHRWEYPAGYDLIEGGEAQCARCGTRVRHHGWATGPNTDLIPASKLRRAWNVEGCDD